MHTNRELTSYLKGFAILTVITGHFSKRFMPEQIMSFGDHFIAIFFILSGYGLYFSLKKQKNTGQGHVLSFYLKRVVRIYPLYWINFALDFVFDPSLEITFTLIIDFLLLHFTDPPRVWFIHALVPCYVLAPAIFNAINKTKKFFLLYLTILFILTNIAFLLLDVPQVRCWMYQGIYLNHLILFCIGMYLPILRDTYNKNFKRQDVVLSFLLMFFSFIQTSNFGFNFLDYNLFTQILFTASTVLFTYIFMFSDIDPPFFHILKKIGIYTYSLYLFEGMYATVLYKVHILEGKNYHNAFWFISFFPIFLLLAAYLEETINNKLNLKKALIATKAQLTSGLIKKSQN